MHGLNLLWWVQEKQMPPAIVATVLAAGDLALMGFELPTGWFADRVGHRASLMLGSLVQVIGMIWCWLGEGISGLVVASVLVALGDGFRSGADQALLYRTCRALDREADFQAIVARAEAAALVSLVVLVLAGGLVVHTAGFAAGWLAETLLCGVGLAIACAMAEPPTQSDEGRDEVSPRTSAAYRQLAIVILPAALLGGAASAASFLAQTTGTTTVVAVTLLVAALTMAEAGGCAIASRLPAATPRNHLALTAIGAVLFIAAIAWPASLPIVALALGFLAGVAQPLRAAAIQRLAGDNIRARAASAASACDMAVSTIVLPLAGWWRGRRRTPRF
jgi:MFS family permease